MSELTPAERLDKQYRELAAAIADQAQAIADGTLTGPRWGHVRRLLANCETLMTWTPDDRSAVTTGSRPAAPEPGKPAATLTRLEKAMIPPRGCGTHHAGECAREFPYNERH